MPLTAPTVTLDPVYSTLSLRFIDVSGDKRGISFRISNSVLPAAIETFLTAFGAATNANIYEVSVSDVWAANPTVSAAQTGAKSDSVYDNIVMLFTDIAAGVSTNLFVPAPEGTLFIASTDDPNPPNLTALEDAFVAIAEGNPELRSLRYTERREINTRTNV